MPFAEYRIAVPKQDEQGNPLKDLAGAAHHHLVYGPIRTEGSWVEPGMKGNMKDDSGVYDHLVIIAEESPKTDSEIKQLAVHVCEVANIWGAFILKKGKNGVQPWNVRNPMYAAGQPADPVALANKVDGDNGLNGDEQGPNEDLMTDVPAETPGVDASEGEEHAK